ncbi:MAG TPA: glycerol-3-phosphate dehydrogenase/oxidase [Anaerolineaceae bacterium]|nr:glycerol-3-phosphate dehydrogenase/oxidase [Anaerolineaceae bacterium]
MERNEIIARLKEKPEIDVLVVGAGINGAGTFMDLSINGVETLIIDRGDFCSGASATSSHMAHGGIRYLENGEFRLVREAVAERNRMIRNSPHMVKPLPTVIPMYKVFSGLLNAPLKFINLLDKPSERGALVIKIGLIFYDSFTGKNRTVPAHKFYGKKESLRLYPHLNKAVKYTALYYDGSILSPEKLNTEIVLEGEKAGPHAMALNYASFEKIEGNEVIVKDNVSGELIHVHPKMVINAAGPWIDQVNKKAGIGTKYVGGTKGSHIIVNNPVLREAIGEHEFFFENKDGRIVLLFPFFDKVIIGTSDLPIDDPDNAYCTPEEELYFIDLVKRVFPEIPITQDQIVFRFSGVRPLEYQEAKTTGQITRDHSIKENVFDGVRMLSMVGGKWTSFRAFSEQVTDEALKFLGKQRLKSTEELHIGGGKNYPKPGTEKNYVSRLARECNCSVDLVDLLFQRYGTMIEEMIKDNKEGTLEVLKSDPLITKNEIRFLAEKEKVIHLDDLLLRRTSIGWLGGISLEKIEEIARIVAKSLGWSADQKQNEIEHVKKIFRENHNVIIE